MSNWDTLSLKDKSKLFRVYVRNGYTDIDSIKEHYNKLALGGPKKDDYKEWLENEARQNSKLWGIPYEEALNEMKNTKTYDYRKFYEAQKAEPTKFQRDFEGNAHYSDIGKSVYHPTASTDSYYSERKDSKWNPTGAKFGEWLDNWHEYRMSDDMLKAGSSPYDTWNYLTDAEESGVRLTDERGNMFRDYREPEETYIGGVLPASIVTASNSENKNYADGGYLDNLTTRPFSYYPLPIVRYDDGGFINNDINNNESTNISSNNNDNNNLGLLGRLLQRLSFNKNQSQKDPSKEEPPKEEFSYMNSDYWKLSSKERNESGVPRRSSIDRAYNDTAYNTKTGDTYMDVIESRYQGLYKALKNTGTSEEDIDRLMPFLLTQTVLEGGWLVSRSDNNLGGMKETRTDSKGRVSQKNIIYDSTDDFYDHYIRNLDEKWGDGYLGKGKGWRNAKTIREYADIINREDLKLYTREDFNNYNKEHRDHPAYLYTPEWANGNTSLMHSKKFGGIYPRVNAYYDLMKERIIAFNKKNKK